MAFSLLIWVVKYRGGISLSVFEKFVEPGALVDVEVCLSLGGILFSVSWLAFGGPDWHSAPPPSPPPWQTEIVCHWSLLMSLELAEKSIQLLSCHISR
jgi:hypothetical protein